MANMLSWYTSRKRAQDWFCWNSLARLALPVAAGALLLIAGLELAGGGWRGLENLFTKGLGITLLWMLLTLVIGAWLLFTLQGTDVLECVLDGKGAHLRIFLPAPTPLKLLLRGLRPDKQTAYPGEPVQTASLDIAWKDIRRVQLWPEKGAVLLYAPHFWLRVWLPCTADTWQPVLQEMQSRLGKKKQVSLPACLRQDQAARPARKSSARSSASVPPASDHLMEDIRRMNAEAEKNDQSAET
ncbi:MAG: hypothetical protein IKP40_07850 [Clostridia bacterium]|nr:hypothetical protein [Clostridia bacterium]